MHLKQSTFWKHCSKNRSYSKCLLLSHVNECSNKLLNPFPNVDAMWCIWSDIWKCCDKRGNYSKTSNFFFCHNGDKLQRDLKKYMPFSTRRRSFEKVCEKNQKLLKTSNLSFYHYVLKLFQVIQCSFRYVPYFRLDVFIVVCCRFICMWERINVYLRCASWILHL